MANTYYSDLLSAGSNPNGRSGPWPQLTKGTVSLPNGTNLGNGDVIKMFAVSAPGTLYELHLDISGSLESGTPALTGTISDDQSSPNVYFVSASKANTNGDTFTTLLQNGGRCTLSSMGEAGMFGVVAYGEILDPVIQINITHDSGGAMAAARTIKFWALTRNT